MQKFIKNNWIYIAIISIVVIVMVFYINKKEGYHEDEMFSYGSSSYVYDNVFRSDGRTDSTNLFLKTKIFTGNVIDVIKNLKYYFIDHSDEKDAFIKESDEVRRPVWKTSEEAEDYLTVNAKEIGNYAMVYYNQGRDVHPPLFYFLVHTVSVFFLGNFSKWIIGIINIAFMIASLIVIKKIYEVLNKKHLIIPGLIFYGLSMGAISTVVFQRMYMMLTFFILEFILININIAKNDFEIDKKTWIKLGVVTILGFLTQYYFCIVAVLIALYVFVKICFKKDKKQILKYILNYFKIALIGVIVFPFSINHIFFSYRGIGRADMHKSFIEKFIEYISKLGYSYSIPIIIFISIIALFIIIAIAKKILNKEKLITKENGIVYVLAIVFVLYMIAIIQISPEFNTLRYIMAILPILSIVVLILIDSGFKNKKISQVILIFLTCAISVYGIMTSNPECLYLGYNKYLKIAEENKHTKFVYVGSVEFNHIQSMLEFTTYDESLIVDAEKIEYIISDEKLKDEKEFILSIKSYEDVDGILKQIIDNTEFKNYELLLNDDLDTECVIYKMKR